VQNCPRCLAFVDVGFPYCSTCGRPRIVENLRAARTATPAWIREIQEKALFVLLAWFVVTLGVAFFREYKAVRQARQAFEASQFESAWTLLTPFLADHPEHQQANLLGGKVAIRLGRWQEAGQYLATLADRKPKLADELRADYQQTLAQQVKELGCNPDGFQQLYVESAGLGPAFPTIVASSLDQLLRSCHSEGNDWAARRMVAFLKDKGTTPP